MMAETPRVSVVMPVHNGGPYVEAAVTSILGQTFRDLEFIIIDDGSSDSTADVLRRYAAVDDRIRVYSQARAGLVASLNRGCRAAHAGYIARMDADDVALPERLERQVAFLDREPEVAVVGSAVLRIDDAGRPLTRNVCPTSHAEIVAALREYTCFTHPSVMMRTAAWAAVGGYRYAYGPAEDYDLWLRLSERYQLANLPEALLQYRVYPGQLSVKQLDQQILSVVGARAAARQRRHTGEDRTPAEEIISAELLRAWGVADSEIAQAMSQGYRYAAYVMLQAAQIGDAVELLRIGRRRSGNHPEVRAMLAGTCSKQARMALRRGHWGAGIAWAAEAWGAQPSLPLQLLRGWGGRKIAGVRAGAGR